MKTVSAILAGGLWAIAEPTTAVLVAASAALFAAFVISVRRT